LSILIGTRERGIGADETGVVVPVGLVMEDKASCE